MKKILLLSALILGLIGCSSDDDNWNVPTKSDLTQGSWSTGITGMHKYLSFEEDNTGYFAIYNGATLSSHYLFNYEIKNGEITFEHQLNGTKSISKCSISGDKLQIEEGAESGVYEKIIHSFN